MEGEGEGEGEGEVDREIEENDDVFQQAATPDPQLSKRRFNNSNGSAPPESSPQAPPGIPISQADAGLLRTIRYRLGQWGGWRRGVLVFGLLTIASVLFWGINYLHTNSSDVQAIAIHPL